VPRTSLKKSHKVYYTILFHTCCRVPFTFTFRRYFTFTYCSKISIILTCNYTLLHLHTARKSVDSCLRFCCTTSPSHTRVQASFSPLPILHYFILYIILYTILYTTIRTSISHLSVFAATERASSSEMRNAQKEGRQRNRRGKELGAAPVAAHQSQCPSQFVLSSCHS